MTEVQTVILDIFKVVADLCERHQIPYYAIGGTCLGAVRHHGFIPWDDDLDIAIPIQYFDEFWEIANKELPPKYQTYTGKKVKVYNMMFGKVHNTETAYIETRDAEFKKSYKGIFIDIMPMSAIPDDPEEREDFYKKVRRYRKYNYMRRFPLRRLPQNWSKRRWLYMRIMAPFIRFDHYSEELMDLMRSHPFGSTSLTGYTWSKNVRKYTFPIEYFESTVDLPFEDTTIRCPVRYKEYLAAQFGDNYMELPPESERWSHKTEIVDIHKSYKEYV